MASVVNIQIRVDDAQAQQSLKNIEDALKSAGVNGSASLQQLKQPMADVDKGMLSNKEKVRLAAEELGLHIPRAMQSVIAQSEFLMTAISAVSTAMVGLGFASIGVMAGKEVYDLAEKWFNVNAQVNEYYEKAGQTAGQKLFDEASLETAVALLNQANAQVDELEKRKASAGITASSGVLAGVQQWLPRAGSDLAFSRWMMGQDDEDPSQHFTKTDDKDLAQRYEDQAKARARDLEQQHQLDVRNQQDESTHREATLHGFALIEQKKQDAIATAKLMLKYTRDQEKAEHDVEQAAYNSAVAQGKKGNDLPLVHAIDPNSGQATYTAAVGKAGDTAADDRHNLAIKERDETISLQNEATNSGLEGTALYLAKRSEAIDAITRKMQEGELSAQAARRQTAAVAEKLDNEEYDRIEKQMQAAQQMLEDARAAGLTGVARINADHDSQINKINTNRDLDPADAGIQRQAAALESAQKIKVIQDDYSEKARQAQDAVAASAEQGYARITAAARKQTNDANAEFDKQFKNADGTYAATEKDFQNHQVILTSIQDKAEQDRLQLQQKAAQTVAQYDAEAAAAESRVHGIGLAGWVTQYQDSLSRIQAQYDAHYKRLTEDARAIGLTDQQLIQAQEDLQRTANAQIEEENQQMRDRIANNLESAFTNPAEFIKTAMQKMMFQIIADWMMQTSTFQRMFGQTMGAGAPGSASQGGFLGALLPHGAGGRAGAGVPLAARAAAAPGGAGGGSFVSADYSGGSSTLTSAGAGGGYSSTTAGSGSYVGAAAPNSTRSGSGAGDYISMAGDGYSQYKTLSADYNMMQAGLPKAASGASADGLTYRSSADGGSAGMINSQDDVDSATSGLGGGKSGTQMAAAGIGAGIATYSSTNSIIGGVEQGGAKSYLNNAMSGAEAGMAVGMMFGPMGALIGAGVGAGVGLIASGIGSIFGVASHEKVRKYFHETLDPQIQQDVTQFRTGGGDFQSAIAGVNKTAADGMAYAQKTFGNSAAQYMMDTYLRTDVEKADSEISRLAKAGSEGLKASAAQFHDGGVITGFGSFATSSTEGLIHALMGETVMNTQASAAHGSALAAINGGADAATMAAHYLSQVQPSGPAPSGSSSDTHHHWNVSAVDAGSFAKMLAQGGIEAILKAKNNFAGEYSGAGRN